MASNCPWLGDAQATAGPPLGEEGEREPEVQICLHCRSKTHKMEDCAAYKAAQAKMKEDWCYGCKQYGHTIVECMDELQEERNKEIEKEIEKRKKQLEEIDNKMEKIKRQAREDGGRVPEDRDTRDYPKDTSRKSKPKPRKEREESEPPQPPPREDPPRGPLIGGAGGGGGPPGGDDPSEPEDSEESDSDSDEDEEEEEEESDGTEATEESDFLYDEQGRKIDINQLYKLMRKRKRSSRDEGEIPIKAVRGPRGHRGSKGRQGRKGPPGKPGVSQNLDRSVDANVTIDTAGLEKTFRDMGESMKDVFASQQVFNKTMKSTLEASAKAQMKQTEALEKLNLSTKQRDHDHMFASIKLYDGKDP